jgi:PPOX class probable F420-dependent enzyme
MLDTTTEAGPPAEARLREEIIIWLTTVRSDGRPQSVPVWFLWDGETFLIYPQPGRQKLKNIGSNPRVGLHLNSSTRGGDVVRIEGTSEVVPDVPAGQRGRRVRGESPGEHRPDRLRSRRLRADLLRGAPGNARPLTGLVRAPGITFAPSP